jgi:hypothetical protein
MSQLESCIVFCQTFISLNLESGLPEAAELLFHDKKIIMISWKSCNPSYGIIIVILNVKLGSRIIKTRLLGAPAMPQTILLGVPIRELGAYKLVHQLNHPTIW